MQGLARPWGLNPGSPGHEGGVTAARDSEWRSERVRSSAMRVSPDSRKRCVDDEQGFAYHRKVPASVWSAGRRPVDHLRKPIGKRHRKDFVVGVRLRPRTPFRPPCPGTGEALVGVSASVDEHQQVTIAHLPHSPVQFREVRRAVDEGSDHVALGPRLATEMAGVQSGRVVFRVRSRSGTTASGAAASWAHSIVTWRCSACRGSAFGFHLSKASLVFSPACLRLLLV